MHSSTSESEWQFKKLALIRLMTANLLVFLFQYMGLVLTTLTTQWMPVWFATGTACAFVFMRGYYILPGIWLGSFLAYFCYAHTNFELAFLAASIFALQSFLVVWVSYGTLSPTLIFYHRSQAVKFIFYSALITASTSYLLASICYPSLSHPITFELLWLQWGFGNWNGLIMLAIAILTWDYYFPQIAELKSVNKLSLSIYYVTLMLMIGCLLATHAVMLTVVLYVALFMLMVLISIKFGWCGIVAANFLIGMVLSFSAFLLPTNVFSFAAVQINLTLCVLLGLILAARNPFKYQT